MWEFMRKSLAFGLGAAMLTGDKLREFVDEAVARGEMSKDDAKKFMDEVSKRGEEETQKLQSWMREQANRILREAGCVEAGRVDALEKRIEALEARLAGAPKTARRRTSS